MGGLLHGDTVGVPVLEMELGLLGVTVGPALWAWGDKGLDWCTSLVVAGAATS